MAHRMTPAAGTAAAAGAEPSVGELFAAASRDMSELVRDEIELAKLEAKDSVKAVGMGAGMLAAAGVLGFVAFILLSVAAANGLVAAGLHPALAFLVVAVVYLVVAGVLAVVARGSIKKAKPPERTIRTAKRLPEVFKRGRR